MPVNGSVIATVASVTVVMGATGTVATLPTWQPILLDYLSMTSDYLDGLIVLWCLYN